MITLGWLTRIVCAAAIVLHSTGIAVAQSADGEINGTISDRTVGFVAGVAVKLTNQGTKVMDQVQTNSSGHYIFINVPPGMYVLGVEARGFKKVEVPAFSFLIYRAAYGEKCLVPSWRYFLLSFHL